MTGNHYQFVFVINEISFSDMILRIIANLYIFIAALHKVFNHITNVNRIATYTHTVVTGTTTSYILNYSNHNSMHSIISSDERANIKSVNYFIDYDRKTSKQDVSYCIFYVIIDWYVCKNTLIYTLQIRIIIENMHFIAANDTIT